MNIIEEILKWSEKLPDWQSDALRRIWIKSDISPQDEDEILLMLKRHNKLADEKEEFPYPIRLSKDHMGMVSKTDRKVILKSMSNLKNVNAIKADQHINFGEKGLTVIYGDNATGKSGYSRVLKRACRARGEQETVHPNVYSDDISPSPAEATIDVFVDGEGDKPVLWRDGQTASEYLANFAVFDTKAARVYVDEANEVSYIPYGLDAFTKLAELCKGLKSQTQNELDRIPQPPQIIGELVGDGKIIKQLTAETSEKDIDSLALTDERDIKRFEDLTKIVAEYKASDPKKKAEAMRRQKHRFNQFRADLCFLASSLSKSAIKTLQNTWQSMKSAQKAAQLASEKAFSKEPLAGTGNNVWRIMFDAAKKFSEEYAYPEKAFPFTGEGSRCLLCQQYLDEEGKDRLARFWEFIQQDTAITASKMKIAFKEQLGKLERLNLKPEDRDPQLIEEIREFSEPMASDLIISIGSFSTRISGIEKAAKDGSWHEVPALIKYSSAQLSQLAKGYESEARKYDSISIPEEQIKTEKELSNLNSRKRVLDNKATIVSNIDALNKKKKLEQCVRDLDTTAITRKQSDLMEQALTGELRASLECEFEEFAISYIPLKLKRTGSIGSTYHQLKLPSVKYEKLDISEILSEGEQTIVAIASFLAEIKTSSLNCGIIFDDPVSSLDHKWREKIAKRLATEAIYRQVIIFTHDIVFLLALEDEAAQQQVPISWQTIRGTKREIGICISELPLIAQSTKNRIGNLKQLWQKLCKTYNTGDQDEYLGELSFLYGLLRATWEKAIEAILFNNVVQRYRPGIETKRLEGVEVHNEDYKAIHFAMKKCSRLMGGHDQAAAVNFTLPEPDEVSNDITQLEDFIKSIRSRIDKVEKTRGQLIKPPKA